jgi:TatD DNase family protein
VIDSHCHLADEVFKPDLEDVIKRAIEAGLERALVILAAGDASEAAQAARVEALWPEVRLAIGVHPHAAGTCARDPDAAADAVRAQFSTSIRARAVGEIGLDYRYLVAPPDVQQRVFRVQLRLARELRRPVVIHTREAEEDTIRILREEGGGTEGVLHCFTGGEGLARAGLDLGFYISLAGIVTFPKAADLRQTARLVPLDRLLAETDSPFLAPVPHRGRRNEPAHVTEVVGALAAIHQMDALELAQQLDSNFHTLFRP